jgi:hypothetical protein
MSKKTVKRHYKKHKHKNKRTYRKHKNKRTYRKHKNKRTYRKHKIKRTYRKNRFKRINNGTGKGVQLFTEPTKIHSQSILVNQIQSGNMIPGLRNM